MSIVPVCWLEGDNGSIGNPNISVTGVRIGDCRSLQADFGRIPAWSAVFDPDFYPAIALVSLAANGHIMSVTSVGDIRHTCLAQRLAHRQRSQLGNHLGPKFMALGVGESDQQQVIGVAIVLLQVVLYP